MTRKKYASLPAAVRDLARRGERYRLPRIWLYDTPRDRVIAAWLDKVAGKNVPKERRESVAEIVKGHLYHVATGDTPGDTPDATAQAVIAELSKRIDQLERNLTGAGIVMADEDDDQADPYITTETRRPSSTSD